MKFKQIARRLSEVIGTEVTSKSLQRFSKPSGKPGNLVEIARQGEVVLLGSGHKGKYNSRKTGKIGLPGYDAYFKLEGLERPLESHRGYLLEENHPRETVRIALEQLLKLIDGDYSGAGRGGESIFHSNII